MAHLAPHIKFIRLTEDRNEDKDAASSLLRYRADSYSASLALKEQIETNKRFDLVKFQFEACMSISAPVFQPTVTDEAQENESEEQLSAEEVKQQQIS